MRLRGGGRWLLAAVAAGGLAVGGAGVLQSDTPVAVAGTSSSVSDSVVTPSSIRVDEVGFCVLGHHKGKKGCRGGSLLKSGPSEPCGSTSVASYETPQGQVHPSIQLASYSEKTSGDPFSCFHETPEDASSQDLHEGYEMWELGASSAGDSYPIGELPVEP